MKLPFRSALLAAPLLLSSLTQASDAPLEDTFKAFTQCDALFFSSLQAHADAWQAFAPLKHSANATWIAVEDRANDAANTVALDKAPALAGVKLLSYFDQSSDLSSLGYYLFWGFIVDGRPEQVARQLAPLIAGQERLQRVDSTYVRSEMRVGDHWQVIKPRPGQAPGTQQLERVLLIEPEGPQGDRSRVSCSLQGAVDGALLAQLRPDIPASEYPRPALALDDVSVPEALRKGVESPLLQPKFKSLRYTYVTRRASGIRMLPVSVEIESKDGLLRKTEIYSGNFHIDRLTQADLIPLKSKLNSTGNGRVLVTRSVDVSLPPGWIPGRTLKVRALMDYAPAKPIDKPSESELTCQIGQRFPARQIFATLSGDAIRLDCEQGHYRSSRAFVEDLGIALVLGSTSGTSRETNEVTALEVER